VIGTLDSTSTERSESSSEPSTARILLRFALPGLGALLIASAIAAVAMDRVATEEALRDASAVTRILADGLIEPAASAALARGDANAAAAVDRVVRSRVLADPILRVRIWTADGLIVYSDVPELLGQRYPLGADGREALETGHAHSELSHVDKEENRFEQGLGPLLEVYHPITAADGTPLLLELYLRYESIVTGGRQVWLAFTPAVLAALLVLAALQLPLAFRMARELRTRHRERETLLRQALDASDIERRRIAGQLHDGVVQELAALSFDLALRADHEPEAAREARSRAAAGVRSISRQLRALTIDLYPPNLRSAGLHGALEDLLAPPAAAGIATSLRYEPPVELDPSTEVLVYRIAREAIRNATAHSRATHIDVVVGHAGGVATLSVTDDGRGFSSVEADRRYGEGHLGVRLMRDLAREAGRRLAIASTPGGGTRVYLEAPA